MLSFGNYRSFSLHAVVCFFMGGRKSKLRIITEHVRNRLTVEANDRFVKSGVDIRDTYGTLDK